MCSSESEAELSLPSSVFSGPALGTRKRRVGSGFIFNDDLEGQEIMDIGVNKDNPDSDEDFVLDIKKKKVSNRKIKKPPKSLNNSATSKSSSSSEANTSKPPQNSTHMLIEVKLKEEETSTKSEVDYNCNIAMGSPVIIATPDQINSRSFDQEEIMTPSSCSIPMEERTVNSSENIVQKLVESVHQTNTIYPPPGLNQQADVTPREPLQPGLSQAALHNRPAGGRGRGLRPAYPIRPGLTRQPTPITRPHLRPSAPRMLRPLRAMLPRNIAVGGPIRPKPGGGPRPSLTAGGPRLPNIRSIIPIKRHRSLSTPHYSSQYIPPVVELDASPPHSDQACNVSHPPASSVVSKLTSLGVSVAREKVSNTKHGWVLPPGLSVTKTTSSTDDGPSISVTGLAKALLQLGEVNGRKRLVQFKLTEAQVRALYALGVREEGV